MKDKFIGFCKNNFLVFIWLLFAIMMETLSLCFMGLSPIISNPLYFFIVFGLMFAILIVIPNQKAKCITGVFMLVFITVMEVGFTYLYDANGTFFEWAMVSQRNDAFGTIEDLNLNWGLLSFLLVLIGVYCSIVGICFKYYYKRDTRKYTPHTMTKVVWLTVVGLMTCLMVLMPAIDAFSSTKSSYVERYLYGSGVNKYQEKGMTSNAIYEMFNGTVANAVVKPNADGIREGLYQEDRSLETSEYFGISKNNNLVYILVESFEWYSFLTNCTPEQSRILYPNLNKLYKEGLYADNFYAREKTDTAEMLALLGSNPTGKYVNYDFPTNAYPFALPNLFRQSVEDNGRTVKQIKSFHQNTGSFYNRSTLHESLGFEELVSIEDMLEYGMINTWNEALFKGERNLDSLTLSTMKEQMFPRTNSGEQFMTFWITFSMHGYYKERQNLKDAGYYDLLDEVGAYPAGKGVKGDYLRTYAAAVMDFDRAVGTMLDTLEANGQLNNTTIVMFGDHNTYYNNLSYYAKGIDERFNSELYRVPFMIYDKKLQSAYVQKNGTNAISKFTTTADMLPTILDIFGIHGYKNLYFGQSMFTKGESIIFSRAYGIFVTDKVICYSLNKILYKREDFDEVAKNDFITRATANLNKLEFIDKIYYNNYFENNPYIPL